MKKVILDLVKKYKWTATLQIVLIGLNIYLLTIPPKIIGTIVDLLYDITTNKDEIILNTVYLLSVCVIITLLRMPWRYLTVYHSRSTERDMKNKVFNHFIRLKISNIENIKNGELMSYFVKDVNEIRIFIYRLLSYGSRVVFTLVIATYTMINGVNLKLTLVTMIPIVMTSFLIVKIKKYVEKSFVKSQKYFTQLSEFVQESTDAIRTTKAYCQEGFQLKEFIRRNKKLKSSNNAVDVHSTLISTCINTCFGLCYGISLLYGSNLVLSGQITTGQFVAFNGYIGLFVSPVSWIPGLISRFKRAQISYYRLDKFMNLEKEKLSVKTKELVQELQGDIKINNLSFYYPNSIEPVLENINLEIKKGETLGIIGSVASGKTTLLNLLIRLYSVKNGKIFIDGKDINEIPIPVLRENISYITQENFLFSSSLKENINLFKDVYDDYFITDSTKRAVIYDEIKHMPEQIYTSLGNEQGVELSGGQRQRIAISRAFLKRSNIIILDDTFSALDNKTEKVVLDNIKELTENKTCIIVSNRISDIKCSDKIIVLDEGRIIEQGTHEELLEKQGKYYSYYSQQSMKAEVED